MLPLLPSLPALPWLACGKRNTPAGPHFCCATLSSSAAHHSASSTLAYNPHSTCSAEPYQLKLFHILCSVPSCRAPLCSCSAHALLMPCSSLPVSPVLLMPCLSPAPAAHWQDHARLLTICLLGSTDAIAGPFALGTHAGSGQMRASESESARQGSRSLAGRQPFP